MRVSQGIAEVARDSTLYQDRQRIRDVPVSCICPWTWGQPWLRWVRFSTELGCPWHSRAPWLDGKDYR